MSATGVSGGMGVTFLKKCVCNNQIVDFCVIEDLSALFISSPTMYLLIPIFMKP